MKHQILILLCLLVTTGGLQAQDNTTPAQEIEMKVKALGYRFYKDGERLTWKALIEETKAVEEANMLIKRANSQRFLSATTAFVGGFLIGFPIGQDRADRDPTWELAYAGGAIALVGLHLSFRAFNNVNKGVDTYNIAVAPKTGYRFEPEFSLVNNRNGLGLVMRF